MEKLQVPGVGDGEIGEPSRRARDGIPFAPQEPLEVDRAAIRRSRGHRTASSNVSAIRKRR
jgi:hypothetical protein